MYIKQLRIKNFRVFDEVSLYLNKGINIIIGENNSGKTAIIDALRICLGFGKSDTNIYIQESDIHLNPSNPNERNTEIQFDLIFEIESEVERQCFNDFISQDPENIELQTIQFHLKYSLDQNGRRTFFKRTVWGGDNEGQQIPYEALQEIFYTYLSPLRDAVTGLKPYSYDNKTAQLFNKLTKYKKGDSSINLSEDVKKSLAEKLYSAFENDEHDWKYILSEGKSKVNDHLEGTGILDKFPQIEMNYVGRKFSDVVRGIEIRRPIYAEPLEPRLQKYFEIYQNGLGENNLIFSSVVLGDLMNRCEDTELEIYNALLLEEPEAHLHPQYQNTFFEYLNTLTDRGLQIFITSHSPTITAKSDINNVKILQRHGSSVKAFCFNILSEVDYTNSNRKYLRKFLDTTKSQMFFASGAILVEGIAEAILLPILSRKFLNPHNIDLEKHGIEIVNIGGVAFEHFAKLYNHDDERKRLFSRCAIITDSDPTAEKAISDRAIIAQGLKKNHLEVTLATNTFEHDLFETSEANKAIMREVYRNMHPKTQDLAGDFGAETLMEKLKQNKDKAEFALQLNDRLMRKERFDVPLYIKTALEFVVSTQEIAPEMIIAE
ncbi:ATP-dependent endonuclease [Dysgonomonas sp.]|uniref:ATP-dependent nuclease n=1 Tax=Dysgonomonas sp. TaxID=1891233 RepID=UPI0027BA7B1D|nr:AAA family ATPase [Dysgonomonas sp.]